MSEANDSEWFGKPYYSLDAYMKQVYGQKIYKIAVDAGLSCPNRDGTLDTRGCIFCSAGGSGDFAVPIAEAGYEHRSAADESVVNRGCSSREVYHREYAGRDNSSEARRILDVSRQIARGKAKFNKKVGERFVIYFQAYTNTYGEPAYLERIWRAALDDDAVVGISIATRPDCLGLAGAGLAGQREDDAIEETPLSLLTRLSSEYRKKGKFIWIELGLQTIHEKSAAYIRRGYPLSVYDATVKALADREIPYITHMILGLPGETVDDMYDTVRYVCAQSPAKPQGIKLQLLHVLRGTDLCAEYENGAFSVFSMDDYIETVISCLELIPRDVVIHRVTGDGPKSILVAPLWSANKRLVLNTLHKRMRETGRRQGTKAEYAIEQ